MALELGEVSLDELQLAVTALGALNGPRAEVGARTLVVLSDGPCLMPAAAGALERRAERRQG